MLDMLNTMQRASVPSRQSGLTDDEALQILLQVNTPTNPPGGGGWSPAAGGCGTPSSRAVTSMTSRPGTKSSGGSSSRRRRGKGGSGLGTPAQAPKEDEETLMTRKFWENWAAEATKSLLADLHETKGIEEELVFSGKCGPEPKFHTLERSESSESIRTDISLLACSEHEMARLPRKGRKRRKAPAKPKTPQVNWEIFARERKGMLDRFIQADASRIEGYMKNRTAPIQNVIQRSKATDVMTKQERRMLMDCAYGRGLTLAQDSKSYSTENIVNIVKSPAPQRLPESTTPVQTTRGVRWEGDARTEGNMYSKRTGRAPSPADIVQSLDKKRPESAIAALNPPDEDNVDSSRASSAASSRLTYVHYAGHTLPARSCRFDPGSRASSPAPTMITMAPTAALRRKHSTVHGLPDLEGVFSSKVKRKIRHTVADLSRATGYGDRTDVCVPIEEEQGVYTDTDYARHPRYPQNIRIAPHLSRVIREDIVDRMGRPRRHEVRMADLQSYDADQPALGRSHSNLLIFNWLNDVTESGYDTLQVPDIADLEGNPPRRTYPPFQPGIVGVKSDPDDEDGRSLPTANSGRFIDDESGSDVSRSDFDSDDSFYD